MERPIGSPSIFQIDKYNFWMIFNLVYPCPFFSLIIAEITKQSEDEKKLGRVSLQLWWQRLVVVDYVIWAGVSGGLWWRIMWVYIWRRAQDVKARYNFHTTQMIWCLSCNKTNKTINFLKEVVVWSSCLGLFEDPRQVLWDRMERQRQLSPYTGGRKTH